MRLARSAALWLAAATQADPAALVSLTRAGNCIRFHLDAGAAEIKWLTPSTFRFRRAFAGKLAETPSADRPVVPLKIEETPDDIAVTTRYVRAIIRKNGLLVVVRKLDGKPVFADLREPEYRNGVVRVERAAVPAAGLYGLGPRTSAILNTRGSVVRASVPFLLSTAGYAEYHTAPAEYTFDLSRIDGYRVEARSAGLLDYCFIYGPTPKEVFEDLQAAGIAVPSPPQDSAEATWAGLRASLLRLLHGSVSGLLAPTFDDAAYRAAPAELRDRALQVASVINPGMRRDLGPYFFAYQQEIRDRGIPPIRPLPFQFPNDPEAARHNDEFMFGDELLAAPVLEPGSSREVYLPAGTWTRLDTNEEFQGRRTVAIQSRGLALFSRNGMIVPLQSARMELHYFPKLAAEFFLFEDESGEYSQVHAAPAADIVRLEIESVRDREYEWVVHHTPKPREAGFDGRALAEVGSPSQLLHEKWYFDPARGNLHIRVRVAAGEDRIVNLLF